MECLIFCVAEQLELSSLETKLKEEVSLTVNRHWNAVETFDRLKSQHCYFFKNGTIVCWNIRRYEVKSYLTLAKNHALNPITEKVWDKFSYIIASSTRLYPHEYFSVDCISLASDDAEIKLALSYGLSQSIKLHYYEQYLEKSISKYTPIIEQLAIKGSIKIPRKHINKILGEILSTKSKLNLTSNFLYQPKFYWQRPNLEEYYKITANYLDIATRAKNINIQLDTLNEIFEMFNSYLQNKHSHSLEGVIILLIAIEIILSLLNIHLG